MAHLEFTRTTQTSITVRLAGLDLTGQANKGTSRLPRHNTYQISCIGDIRTVSTGSNGNSGSVTYSGLSPGTTYDFAGLVNYTDEKGKTSDVYIPDTGTTEKRPDYDEFSWTYAGLDVSTGAPVAGPRKRGGLGVYVTADEWNELIDNANERLGKTMGHVRQGGTISASVVNILARALGADTVSSNGPIRAAFFNQLMDAVNNAG